MATGFQESYQTDEITKANLVYRGFLDSYYSAEFFHKLHHNILRRNKYAFHIAAFGAIISAGTALLCLAIPEFLYLSIGLSLITATWCLRHGMLSTESNLEEIVKAAEYFTVRKANFRSLSDEIQVERRWTCEFEMRLMRLQTGIQDFPMDTYKSISSEEKLAIQNRITNIMNYKSWWQWQDQSQDNYES